MRLDEFFDYKNELMKIFCSNEKIVRLVTDSKESPVPNGDLAYTQFYPYEFIPETVSNGATFICFDVDIAEVENSTYYVPVVYVWIFTHKSKMRLPEGGVRTDQLAVEINKELCGSRYFGLGKLALSSVKYFTPILDYQGRVLTFYARDFNNLGDTRRPPTNRKRHG